MSKRVGLRYIGSVAAKKVELYQSAWSYFDVQGSIYLADPSGSEGGNYFDR